MSEFGSFSQTPPLNHLDDDDDEIFTSSDEEGIPNISGIAASNITKPEIKRLFFIWFNSVSTDNESLTLSQFSSIINRIFVTDDHKAQLNADPIIKLFNQLSDGDNKDKIYFNDFLSPKEDTFANVMIQLLETNDTAISMLRSVPRSSSNNPNSNTLQQILYDQSKETQVLRKWINKVGIPSRTKSSHLLMKLHQVEASKSKLQLELQHIDEENISIKNHVVQTSKEYSAMEEDLTYSVRTVEDLVSINTEINTMNDELQSNLNSVTNELKTTKEESKKYDDKIDMLTALTQKYQEQNLQLIQKDQQNTQQIAQLSLQKSQMELQVE